MALPKWSARALAKLSDASIVRSFDRHGFERHAATFDAADLGVDLSGRVSVVTGANSGLGFEIARGLAERGSRVYLLCRNAVRGRSARDQLAKRGDAHLEIVDVSDLSSVRAFCDRFSESTVDHLVNNAGVLLNERRQSTDGFELTLATHVLGHFLLTHLLVDKLSTAKPGRVITVSSGGMYAKKLNLQKLWAAAGSFNGVDAYAQAKRAQVELNELWSERWAWSRIWFACMHPGWADTKAVRESLPKFYERTRSILRNAEQGADTAVWLAARQELPGRSGLFWFDREPRRTHLLPWTRTDDADRADLWTRCTTATT